MRQIPAGGTAPSTTCWAMADDPSQIPSPDLGYEAHKAAVAYLHACEEAAFDGEGDGSGSPDPLFCGCTDCVVRAVLTASFDYLVEAAARGDMLTLTPCPDVPPA